MCDKDICIYDLCDGYHMADYCADWCPETKLVTFGGWWNVVEPMSIDHEPTELEIQTWVESHMRIPWRFHWENPDERNNPRS